jgi:AraC-like DNA-binding protein
MNNEIITEITPLSEKDCFYIVERYKSEFTFPLHSHEEYELNFIENGAGVRRIVGDSIEEINNYELVLIGNKNLVHVWEQGNCTTNLIREITIQFSPELFIGSLLTKNQFSSIRSMFEKAKRGLSFPISAIIKVYSLIDSLTKETSGFYQVLKLLTIFYELSTCEDSRMLASSSFVKVEENSDSRRILKAKNYINTHYSEDIKLSVLAELASMTSVSFSRFFKQRTGKNLSEYIIEIRLGVATRLLIDSTKTVAEICYECGFNNLSNFNRIFKKKKGITPKDFRANFRKKKLIV